MSKLTLAQIDALVAQAQAAGLTPYEVQGLREVLLYRAAEPANVDKLGIAIELLPATQRATVKGFIETATQITDRIKTRGRESVMGMSEDEWNGLFKDDGQV
jgi:hypothetical protein